MSTAALTVVVGSPQTVREYIARMRERTGFNIPVCILQFGVMPVDLVRRNIEIFAAEVMPYFASRVSKIACRELIVRMLGCCDEGCEDQRDVQREAS